MTKKEASRSTNPPYLGDYHRMRLYPRHWDMTSIAKQNGSGGSPREVEERANAEPMDDDNYGVNLSPKAFDEWHISRHYPSDDAYRCDTFSAF